MSQQNGAVHVFAKMVAKPGQEQRLQDALKPLVEASRAESGCLAYDAFVSTNDAAVVRLKETWQTGQALMEHTSTPAFLGFAEQNADAMAEPIEVDIVQDLVPELPDTRDAAAPIHVFVKIQARAGAERELQDAVAALVRASNGEDGCQFYRAYASNNDPTIIRFQEQWKSRDALDAHNQAAHFLEFFELSTKLLGGPPEIDPVRPL